MSQPIPLNDRGSGYSDDIAGAIRHAADEAVRTGSKVVISMSLGSSGKDSMIASAVDYAYSKGTLVVAAAGNDGYGDNTIGYPGALVNAVAVAALGNVQQNGPTVLLISPLAVTRQQMAIISFMKEM